MRKEDNRSPQDGKAATPAKPALAMYGIAGCMALCIVYGVIKSISAGPSQTFDMEMSKSPSWSLGGYVSQLISNPLPIANSIRGGHTDPNLMYQTEDLIDPAVPLKFVYRNPSNASQEAGEAMYYTGVAKQRFLDFAQSEPWSWEKLRKTKPTVVTYFSRRHLDEALAHIQAALRYHKRIVAYGLDLRQEHHDRIESLYGDRVIVRTFNHTHYPEHFTYTKIYPFKFAVWTAALQEFGWCIFIDASVWFTRNVVHDIKDKMMYGNNGDGSCVRYIVEDAHHPRGFATWKQLRNYLPTDEDKYVMDEKHSMQQSTGFSAMNSPECKKYIFEPGWACTLDYHCLQPGVNASIVGSTRHRYDQSLLDLLTGNLYGFQDWINKTHAWTLQRDDVKPFVLHRNASLTRICKNGQLCIPREEQKAPNSTYLGPFEYDFE